MREARQVVAAFFERLWNARKLDLAEELIDPDCRTHQLQPGADPAGAARGPAAIRHHIEDWLRAFPDLEMRVRQSVAEGDRVATHCTMTGSHEGAWMGVAATGQRIDLEMMVIHRVAEGRIVEDWVLVDSYGLFQQLGLVPPKPALLSGEQVFVQPS
ncbi:MAG: ester cyclase [Sphingomonadaceae bacterium]|nr:ester cyclase [Sphingomonadaceae bacterium]